MCELETFNINNLHVESLNADQDGNFSAMVSFDYNILCQKDNPRIKKMVMKFSITPNQEDETPRCPYAIDVEIEGIFSFPDDMPEEKVDLIVRVNGMTILYGILRGEIANVTGSFKSGKFILPTVMMQDVVKDIEARKTKHDTQDPPDPN